MHNLLHVLTKLLTDDRIFPVIVVAACVVAFVPLLIPPGLALLFVDYHGKPFGVPNNIRCDCGSQAVWSLSEPLTGCQVFECPTCGKILRQR